MATRKNSKKNETPEQKLDRWMSDTNRAGCNYDGLMQRGWEPGQVAYIECYGMRYEKFDLENGKFCIVEWDDNGNICVA